MKAREQITNLLNGRLRYQLRKPIERQLDDLFNGWLMDRLCDQLRNQLWGQLRYHLYWELHDLNGAEDID